MLIQPWETLSLDGPDAAVVKLRAWAHSVDQQLDEAALRSLLVVDENRESELSRGFTMFYDLLAAVGFDISED